MQGVGTKMGTVLVGHQNGCYRTLLTSVADLHYAAPLSEIAEAAVHEGPAFAQSAIWDRFAVWSRIWAGREEDLRRCSLRGVPGRRFIHPKQIGEKVRAYLANLDRGLARVQRCAPVPAPRAPDWRSAR